RGMAGDRAPPDRRHKRQYHAPVLARALPAGRRSVCAGPRSAAQSRAGDRPDRIGRVVLRESRRYGSRPASRRAGRGTLAPARQDRDCERATCLRLVPRVAARAAVAVARVLEGKGMQKFAHPFGRLLAVIAAKRRTLVAAAPPRHSAELRAFDQAVAQRLAELEDADVPKRIWSRDPTVWKAAPATPEITDRLGWLNVGKMMAQQVKALAAFAEEIRQKFDRVVLC